jgi:hypothetical protein
MEERQVKLDSKIEAKMEDLTKLFNKMPDQIAGQVNGQSEKSLDAKLQNLQKSIQAVEAKVQALSTCQSSACCACAKQPSGDCGNSKVEKRPGSCIAANQAAAKAGKRTRKSG